jgi:hypothetical protein
MHPPFLPRPAASHTIAAGGLHKRLSARWVIADYPALARPDSAQVQVPDFCQPEM